MCYLYFFCLHCCHINIHIFDYPDSRLSGLFTEVPTSSDNQGSTVFYFSRILILFSKGKMLQHISEITMMGNYKGKHFCSVSHVTGCGQKALTGMPCLAH